MIYILPPGAIESERLPVGIVGTLKQRLIKMLEISSEKDDIVEMDSDEYETLRDTLLACDVDFRVVVGVPDVQSPRSFLFELDGDKVIAYSSLEMTPDEAESDFIKGLNLDLAESTNTTI